MRTWPPKWEDKITVSIVCLWFSLFLAVGPVGIVRIMSGQAYRYYDEKFPITFPDTPPELIENFRKENEQTRREMKIIVTIRAVAAVLVYGFSAALAIGAARQRSLYACLAAGAVLLIQCGLLVYAVQSRNG